MTNPLIRRLIVSVALAAFASGSALGNNDILPADETFEGEIPLPENSLGWPVGTWHARPEQIERYFEALAEASPKARLETIGHTHEQRPLLNLIITSEENQARLDALREEHLRGEGPVVISLGYSIHGNEASGSNAALLVAYHLLAGEAPWIDELLSDTIIILDPMLNPDGLSRFATWANMHRGQNPVADRSHREHNEAWPSGRFNHYWFDMNRDWLPLTQPESVARVRQYQRWKPNIFGDYHEQGSDAGYFFQPGVPERTHPLTPAENQRLTTELARFHAEALDEIGTRYFSREAFDDFYYGKGSTYPDIQGTIGILFEQASVRGHLVDSQNGVFSFTDAVKNHYATSISTIRGGYAMREALKAYQRDFWSGAGDRAKAAGVAGWVFGDHGESGRALKLARLLQQHQVEVLTLDDDLQSGDMEFAAGESYLVPANQPQAGLVQATFERRTEFADNTFYDVSAWTLPLAYHLKSDALKRLPAGEPLAPEGPAPEVSAGPLDNDAVAWRFSGDSLEAGALAIALANAELPVYRVISPPRPLAGDSSVSQGDFLVMRLHNQDTEASQNTLNKLLKRWPMEITTVRSGFNLSGVDLGSSGIKRLQPLKPLLLTGRGLNPMETGHIWHLLDRRLGVPVPMLDVAYDLPELHSYTHILMADGEYSSIPEKWHEPLGQWLKQGGVLITQKRSAEWAGAVFAAEPGNAEDSIATDDDTALPESIEDARKRRLEALSERDDLSAATLGQLAYGSFDRTNADRVLGGAIFAGDTDNTHPLMSGVGTATMPVLLNRLVRLQPSGNAFSTPLRLPESVTPLAGFASEWMRDELGGQPLLIAERIGDGALVRFAFNANYRAFWRGTEQLYINALINAPLLETTQLSN